ncbi:NAD-dependent epimerase/dehydratase family protein [Acidimicrobiia bacterium]|nr:NAD-dependent epimerase/dehydratase family protein [Candidatus Actinomarina sp.]MDA9845148.1 NAD-dependent epimerase/dehydratase family protein [Acidimicrobiia bacterium]
MDTKSLLFISGITGFIGTSLLMNNKITNKFEIIGCSSSRNYKLTEEKLVEISSEKMEKYLNQANEIRLLHLATFFSMDKEDDEKVNAANLTFGINLLEKLQNLPIKKIIYINTIFTLSGEKEILNSKYVHTKKSFSKKLDSFCKTNHINYDEIFIGNTFGKNDNRKKIIPLIIQSLKNGEKNPVINQDTYINFTDVGIIINFIDDCFEHNSSEKYIIYSKYQYNLGSIYTYLESVHNKRAPAQIKSKHNEIKENIPPDIKLLELDFDIYSSLIKLID